MEDLAARVQARAGTSRRFLLGICGPPGAGKSTVAAALCAHLGPIARHVPMDGFHLAQAELLRLGREDRKGAVDTFDVPGFAALLRRLRAPDGSVVYAPEFRREIEEPIAGAIPVGPSTQIVVVEGNYLLWHGDGWGEIAGLLDEVWYLSGDPDASRRRLVDRQLAGGEDLAGAQAWVDGSDARNARLVASTASRAALRFGAVVVADAAPSLPVCPAHRASLADHTERLLAFGEAARVPGGFAWLGADGVPDEQVGVLTRITARMTYSYSLACLWGRPGSATLAEHGVAAMRGALRDAGGGWRNSLSASSRETKYAYDHAFVVLAASAASAAGVTGGRDLLDDALAVVLEHFWDDGTGRVVDSLDGALEERLPYRGANSSMHMTEAFLAAGHATGDHVWFDRAVRIIRHIVLDLAARHAWRVPEHFTEDWTVDPGFNGDRPFDRLQPPGITPGHGLEWARLCLHAAVAGGPAAALTAAARNLIDRAIEDGWDAGRGWLYTVDGEGRPLVTLQLHWVLAEALSASAALYAVTGEERNSVWYGRFWHRAATLFIDRGNGSWRHELTPEDEASDVLGRGRPDVYHALQAMLIPRLPWSSSVLAMCVAGGGLLREDADSLPRDEAGSPE